MGDRFVGLVRHIHHALGDRAALADGLVVVMEVDAAVHVLLGAERRQGLRAHVAEIAVAADEVRPPRCLG